MGFLHSIGQNVFSTYIFSYDAVLAVLNIITPSLPEGKVTPGFDGKWPEYVPSKEGDSRCSCPALNAMANHGILPHDGKNIRFTDMGAKIRTTYNFATTFCQFVPNFAAEYLKKSYSKDTFDLADLDLHNAIEHDGSLTRQDALFCPVQGTIPVALIEKLLAHSTGKDAEGRTIMTKADLSAALSQRTADSKATNPEYTTSLPHRMFGASNASTMLTIFGGRVEDLRVLLLEERLPEGWQSQIRSRFGLTFAAFNSTVLPVLRGVKDVPPSENAAQLSGVPAKADGEAEAEVPVPEAAAPAL
ncbi:Cloroperoxidase [Athelia psychrophila]|uniref:Cloroperoxidase n=1 Tax=Athelia psychrophila TaxID=1759441 RepID=A0A166CKI9_9AGAM|nr:Cloroperoxidase [Fibularhizoctonia sp. CBS 109695]